MYTSCQSTQSAAGLRDQRLQNPCIIASRVLLVCVSSFIGRAERAHLVVLSARFIYIVRTSSSQCACVTCARFYLGESQSLNDLFSTNTVVVFVGEGKERESVVPANLCIVVGCATKRARGYRDRRGNGGQLDVVCGTGLYRLGGTFLGLTLVAG